MYFTKEHLWIKQEKDLFFVGFTNYNIESLGDVVYIELPQVGKVIQKEDSAFVIESVKTSSEIDLGFVFYVQNVNEKLKEDLLPLNKNPKETWILQGEIENFNSKDFLTEEEYTQYIKYI